MFDSSRNRIISSSQDLCVGQRIRFAGYLVQNNATNTLQNLMVHLGLVSQTLDATAGNLTFAAFENWFPLMLPLLGMRFMDKASA